MSGIVVSDLDGTLLRPDHTYHPADLETLRALGQRGIVRCIATGRNLYSVRLVVPDDMPVDYVVFSSGAGTVSWPGRALLERHLMAKAQVELAFGVLRRHGVDFMVHDPVPENHGFVYFAGPGGPDFVRRIDRYRQFARPGDPSAFAAAPAAQLLAVVDGGPQGELLLNAIREDLGGLSIVRSTSPLDGASTWIEIFAPLVSKGQAAARLAERHAVQRADAFALGNDYNDEDLLSWAGTGILVAGAPDALRTRFREVDCGDGAVLTRALENWIDGQGRQRWK